MAMEVLFASSPVANLDTAIEWYERFFGRAADIIPNDEEAMWSVTDNGWLYVITDPRRAGRTVVTISVGDLAEFIAALADRGIGAGPIEAVGDEGMKSNVRDPDGNVLSLIQVASAS
jgi:predicted enzyme related to lactoylglutathione lyase